MRRIPATVTSLLVVLSVASGAAAGPAGRGGDAFGKEANLGRVDAHGNLAAVLERGTGAVSLVDLRNPSKVVGRYDDDARQSLDGDVAFSHDGNWVFYARQTVQFSKDGLHVIDVSDPASPTLRLYQPGGGAFRVDSYFDGTAEWVFLLDAVTGLVVYRFEPTTGALAPVHVDALPALKVGGPASAGIFIDEKDPKLGVPLLYVTTGRTGLQVFDISDPAAPLELGSWDRAGLAEVEVVSSRSKRMVYAATEYWFEPATEPEVVVLDAGDLGKIKERARWSIGAPAKEGSYIQGMDMLDGTLYVAHSERYLVALPSGRLAGPWGPRPCHAPPGGGCLTGFLHGSISDVEAHRGELLVTESLSGGLHRVDP